MSEPLERCPVCQDRWKSTRAQTCMGCRRQQWGRGQPPPRDAHTVECPACNTVYGGQAPGVCTTCGAALRGGRA